MDRRELLRLAGALPLARSAAAAAQAAGKQGKMLELKARKREPAGAGYAVRESKLKWNPAQTAVIVCDMWDHHWCQGASRRVTEMAPRMNEFLNKARERGVLIIHSPSGCMEFYAEHPGRKFAQAAPAAASPPAEIGKWCYSIPAEERGKYPVDQSDGGCDDSPACPGGSPWRREIAALEIRNGDAVSDSGTEIWNLFEQRGIANALVLGVHLNMCVLGRPFGLRNLARYGKNAVLVRDLTDTMYNSRAWPHVNHFRGTELVVEHVEKFVCPSITSDQLLGGVPFRFREDTT